MVPCEPEGPNQMDDDVPLSEGFHWDSLFEFSQVPSRKRSLSESNVVKESPAGTSSLPKAVDPVRDSPACGPSQPPRREELQSTGHLENQGSKGPSKGPEEVEEDGGCISESELIDTQGAGKKRRAPGVSFILSTMVYAWHTQKHSSSNSNIVSNLLHYIAASKAAFSVIFFMFYIRGAQFCSWRSTFLQSSAPTLIPQLNQLIKIFSNTR